MADENISPMSTYSNSADKLMKYHIKPKEINDEENQRIEKAKYQEISSWELNEFNRSNKEAFYKNKNFEYIKNRQSKDRTNSLSTDINSQQFKENFGKSKNINSMHKNSRYNKDINFKSTNDSSPLKFLSIKSFELDCSSNLQVRPFKNSRLSKLMNQAKSNNSPQRLREIEHNPENKISTIRESEVPYRDIEESIIKMAKDKYQSFYKPLGENEKLMLNRLNSIPKTRGGNLESIISRREMSHKNTASSLNRSIDMSPIMKQIFTSIENSALVNQKIEQNSLIASKQNKNPASIELKGTSFKGRYMKNELAKPQRRALINKDKSRQIIESNTFSSLEVVK